MVANDFSKDLLAAVDKLASADLILIDLIDERFDLVALPTGEMITHSNELAESGLLAEEGVAGYKVIPQGSFERRELWLQGMHRFLGLLKSLNKLDAVLVNKVYWASSFEFDTQSVFPVGRGEIDKANEDLEWMYGAMERVLDSSQFLNFDKALLTADEFHRWGVSPFHYCEMYYREALAQIVKKSEKNRAVLSPGVERAPIKPPPVCSGVELNVAAHIVDDEIYAHCSLSMNDQACEGGDFAFYLLVDGVRHAARWYEKSPNARFAIPDHPGKLEVAAFYKDEFDEKLCSKENITLASSS
ncbi:hypothetical protein PPUJ20028_27000 [Pseudomonas putida]|uniref:Uncharacterized protein n=2 Tax=Pseudomonas putida TaxID=303 RepID=A0AA37R697_PSEPU|nr:hypothetical protein PPUJ20028_27000 [Pseudomonas putida]GLO33897.1 hypothetical protein PPUN14671_07300 [Pseudomonas putida]